VITAGSAQEALETLDGRKFDALISDIGLPGTSGYELIREARRRQPLKGIALSGLGMDEDVKRSKDAGFHYHLTKPINFQELRAILEKISV
jgi:CheY-like chemotaxis protein